MLILPRHDPARAPTAPACRSWSSTTAIRLVALAVAAAIQSVQPVLAHDALAAAAVQAQRVDVQVLSDGRLAVVVSNAPISEVIGAVAAAAGVEVSTVGPIPRDPVSVEFSGRPLDEILTALMNSATINFVLTHAPDGTRRLLMGLPVTGAQRLATAPIEPKKSPLENDQKTSPIEQRDSVLDVSALDRQAPPTASVSGPAEWPHGIEPATFGAPAPLPQSREEIFLAVNGTPAVTLPAGAVTPNAGPPPRPDQIEPVNKVGARVSGALETPSQAASAAPGLKTSTTASTTASAPTDTSPAKVPQAPQTIRVPAPIVVEFPPPPKP
jgi:hypothetical protein